MRKIKPSPISAGGQERNKELYNLYKKKEDVDAGMDVAQKRLLLC